MGYLHRIHIWCTAVTWLSMLEALQETTTWSCCKTTRRVPIHGITWVCLRTGHPQTSQHLTECSLVVFLLQTFWDNPNPNPILLLSHVASIPISVNWIRSGWWFQTFFLFSTIYGMPSFPLTNSLHHFSRWLKHVKTTNQISTSFESQFWFQWPFQDPKLEVPTIYKAYI